METVIILLSVIVIAGLIYLLVKPVIKNMDEETK